VRKDKIEDETEWHRRPGNESGNREETGERMNPSKLRKYPIKQPYIHKNNMWENLFITAWGFSQRLSGSH